MKRFFLTFGLISLFVVSMSMRAEASALNSLRAGGINELEDIDFEFHAEDVGNDGQVKQGDLLLAILEVDRNNFITGANLTDDTPNSTSSSLHFDYLTTTDTFTAISLIKVLADPVISGGGLIANYVFEAATAQDWLDYTGLADVDAGTMAVFFDDPSAGAGINHIDHTTVAGGVATTTNGTRLWEMGFTGAAGEFWNAQTLDTSPIGGFDPTDIHQITGLDFLASLNVVDYNAGITLNKHRALADPDLSGPAAGLFTDATHLHLQGNSETGDAGEFDIRTDTNLYIVPTPEPSTMLLWAGVAGVAGALGARRRRRTADVA